VFDASTKILQSVYENAILMTNHFAGVFLNTRQTLSFIVPYRCQEYRADSTLWSYSLPLASGKHRIFSCFLLGEGIF